MVARITIDDPLLDGYRRPEIMAIGDSIFNGVRSLTINAGLAALSPPAQMARALGLDLISPIYPREVLFDVEKVFRDGGGILDLVGQAAANAALWIDGRSPWSPRPFFDNIAIAAAAIDDLSTNTFETFYPTIPSLARAVSAPGSLISRIVAIGRLYYAINASFLLNPARDDRLAALTPIDLVALRRPRRLLVNIGNNEGLFRAGITGDWNPEFRAGIDGIPAKLAELARHLGPAVAEVERVYVNLMVRPRTLANLWTRSDDDGNRPPGCDAYFDRYVSRLAGFEEMTGAEMKAFDELVLDVNRRTRDVFAATGWADKVAFVDLYALSSRHDGKHGCETAPLWLKRKGRDIRLTNKPLNANISFMYGGLFGLDNMHPTTVGYALLAGAMAEVVSATERRPIVQPISLQEALDQDTLLQDLPAFLDLRSFFYNVLASLFAIGSRVGAPVG